jgi:hypothetical protein
MALTAFERATRVGGQEIGQVFHGGQEAEFVFGKGTQVFPNLPVEIFGVLSSRVVLDAGQQWFEVGFRMDGQLTGNAAAGWADAGNYFKLDLEWSPDLANWSAGKFVPAPAPVIDLGGGVYEYWSRALNPQDAAIKSGQIRVSFGMPGLGEAMGGADPRNNPLTALTIAGVALPLGGFPYTMPGDAARMQTDLRVFYPTATVEATTDLIWAINIPYVSQTLFSQSSKVFWPGYLVPDFFGNLTGWVDGYGFAGSFVNEFGVPIVTKAFARLKITSGTRYHHLLP